MTVLLVLAIAAVAVWLLLGLRHQGRPGRPGPGADFSRALTAMAPAGSPRRARRVARGGMFRAPRRPRGRARSSPSPRR